MLKFEYCYMFSARTIDPLSEGLVAPPLGVEKLSPRLKIKLFA